MKSAVERIVFPQAPKGSWLKAVSARMAQERTQIRGVSDSNRKRSADELAQRLSAAPPPKKKAIWNADVPALTELVRGAHPIRSFCLRCISMREVSA
jgi:hypothetical protein